jgi:hypothetical protein
MLLDELETVVHGNTVGLDQSLMDTIRDSSDVRS